MKNRNFCFRYLQQHFQTNKKSIFLLLVFGSRLVPIGSHLVPFSSHVAPTWSHLGPLVQLGSYLDPTRSRFGLHLVPLWSQLVPTWSRLVPTWSQFGPNWGVLLVSWAPEKLPKQVKNQHFLIFVPTWVCGRLGAVLEVSWKCLGPSLERIWTSWGRPGGSWNFLRGVFGSSWGGLGAS